MAIDNSGVPQPPHFDGTGNGAAWFKLFTIWVVTATTVEADKIIVFKAYMEDAALKWYNELKEKPKTWDELESVFLAKYPGTEVGHGLFFEDDDHHGLFLNHLSLGATMDTKTMLEVVETTFKDRRNADKTAQILYVQEWVKQAYDLAGMVPGITELIKGTMLRNALPTQLQRHVMPSSVTIYDVARDIMRMNVSSLRQDIETARNVQLLLNRQPPRTNQTTSMMNPTGPGSYQQQEYRPQGYGYGAGQQGQQQPRGPTGYQPLSGQQGGGPSPPQGLPAVRGQAHLTYDATAQGRAAYEHELGRYHARYGDNPRVYASVPYPLTPGTKAPGQGICDACGQPNHLRADCPGPYLPEREVRFRGVNSKRQRDEDRMAVGSLELYGDDSDYDGYPGEGLGNGQQSGNARGQL